jgi:microcystin-dependent protein
MAKEGNRMSTPYLSEVRIVSFNFPPKGWAFCNGQTLAIDQNQALFALLGTTYGGDGIRTFALPNLQGRIPVHLGNGFTQGQSGGEATHTLNVNEIPAHAHTVQASKSMGTRQNPEGNYWAAAPTPGYAAASTRDGVLAGSSTGGSQPHENRPPYLALSFVIALQGIFPSQN